MEKIDGKIHRLIDTMAETMYDAPGIGLAAPQIGVPARAIIVDVTREQGRSNLIVLINPELIWSEGESAHEEGCLSVPDFSIEIKRKEKVSVSGFNLGGKKVVIEADGLLAKALQHELDHLNGRLVIDHASRLKRDIYRRRMKKLRQ